MQTRFARILLSKAGDPKPGGGGDPKPDDDDDDDKFAERFNKLFHSAMNDRESRFEKKMAKLLETSTTSLLEKITKEQEEKGKKNEDGDDGKKGKLSPEVEQRIKSLEEVATKAKKTADEEKSKREAAEAKSRKQEELQLLTSELTGAKVRDKLLRMAVNDLQRKLARDEDTGEVRWKNDDGNLVEVKAGVAAYLKTDEGKELLPPKDIKGAGSRNLGAGGGTGGEQAEMSDSDMVSALFGQ